MLRRSLAQIGGPYAVTFWAWLITLPLTVLVSSVYARPPSTTEIFVWTTALILIHIAIGLIMLVARLTVLSAKPRRPRPMTALALFAVLGFVRAVLLWVAQEWTGLGAFDLTERLAFNVVAAMMIYSAIAIVVDEFRTDAEVTRRLESAQQTLVALKEREHMELLHADEQILASVRDQLEKELRAEQVDGQRLRTISEAIVRGVSHELVEPVSPDTLLKEVTEDSSGWSRLATTIARMGIPPALLVVVPLEFVILPAVATRFGILFALINAIVGAAPIILGLWILRRYLPLPKQPLLRVLTMAIVVALVTSATSALNLWTAALFVDDFFVSIPAVGAGVTGLALVASGWIAASEGRNARQQELTEAVGYQAQEVARLQGLLTERRQAAARFLHGTVQNELVAASLRGDSIEDVQEHISRVFDSYGSVTPDSGSRATLEGLLRSWSTVLDVTTRIDNAAWRSIANDGARGALLVDFVSEALTNAVRHATGRSVVVEVMEHDGSLNARVETEGAPRTEGQAGIGLKDLRDRGVEVQLVAEGQSTILVGRLP